MYVSDTCGRANLISIRIRVEVEIFESERKSCGFKNIQIRVDRTEICIVLSDV